MTKADFKDVNSQVLHIQEISSLDSQQNYQGKMSLWMNEVVGLHYGPHGGLPTVTSFNSTIKKISNDQCVIRGGRLLGT